MEDRFNFIKKVRQGLKNLNLQSTSIDPSLKFIKVEGGWITLDIFRGEKIAKAVFSIIEISSIPVTEQSILIYPDEGYDLPIFWCNLTQMQDICFHIFDLLPLLDPVLFPASGKKYLSNLPQLKKMAIDHLKDVIIEKDFAISSPVVYAFSPFPICVKLTTQALPLLDSVLEEYAKEYVKLWQKAGLVTETQEEQFSLKKREAIRQLMKENDPGYPLMIQTFGKEITIKVFDIVF